MLSYWIWKKENDKFKSIGKITNTFLIVRQKYIEKIGWDFTIYYFYAKVEFCRQVNILKNKGFKFILNEFILNISILYWKKSYLIRK